VRWIAQLPCDIGRERPIPDCTILTTPGIKLRQESKNPIRLLPQTRRYAGAYIFFGSAAASLFRQARPVLRLGHPKSPVFRFTLGELSAQRSA
jgi:hypothetical protein